MSAIANEHVIEVWASAWEGHDTCNGSVWKVHRECAWNVLEVLGK